jgi:phosphate transport system substrate-binding protein
MVPSQVCLLAAIAALPWTTGCVAAPSMGRDAWQVINVDGSSTVFPISEAVAEEFQKMHPAARITVGISGTGGGFQKFCRGEIDISDASRPIRPPEIEACGRAGIGFIELPVAYDGIAIVANPEAHWIGHVTVEELKHLWSPEAQGRVTRWSQIRRGWPDREIHLFGAGVDSGTFDYFTEAVIGRPGASRGDFTSSEDDNVIVQGIAGDELALGFLPYAYFRENRAKLKLVPVDDGRAGNGEGPVSPTADTIRRGTYQPLSRPILIYVAETALRRREVQQFVEFYLARGGALVEEVGYVELGDEGYHLVAEHLRARRLGTVFGDEGSTVGLTIEQLLSRERSP